MRFASFVPAFVLLIATATSSVQARATGTNPTSAVSAARSTAPAAPAAPVLRKGTVSTTAGVLPGAVVTIVGTNQMAVTNSDGEFQVLVPAGSGPLTATVSYAGFADETAVLAAGTEASAVRMTTVKTVHVDKAHQLKTYQKTARKQVKRSLRQVRKAK